MLAIRKGELTDKPRVMDMLTRVWDDDYVPNMWEEWVTSPHLGTVLVAEYDGEMAGTCYVNFMAHHSAWFQAMRVEPKFRRRGVGSKLTEASLAQARTAEINHVYLGIDADNTPSLEMTARAGFEQLMDYHRLSASLPPRPEGDGRPATLWRQAVPNDLDDLERIAGDNPAEPGLFACWQWQPLSRAAIERNIEQHKLWVWGRDEARVWAGFEDFGSYIALFPPYGREDEILAACDDLLSYLPRQESATFEVWLNPESALLPYLRTKEFAGTDCYTIWVYQL